MRLVTRIRPPLQAALAIQFLLVAACETGLPATPGGGGMTAGNLVGATATAPVNFAAPAFSELHQSSNAVATIFNPPQAVHIDNDGNLDIFAPLSNSGSVGLGMGNGDGTFDRGGTGAGSSYSVAFTGDFNNDSVLDFLTKEFFLDESLRVFLGPGFNGVTPVDDLRVGPRQFPPRDYNNNGNLDLMFAEPTFNGDRKVSFRLLSGNGNGTFGNPELFGEFNLTANNLEELVGDVMMGDFNGDSTPDFAFLLDVNVSVIVVGLGNPAAPGISDFVVTRSTFDDIALALSRDLNDDGLDDLILQERRDISDVSGSEFVHVFFSNGSGGFSSHGTIRPSDFPFSMAIGMINDDNLPDLAIATGITIQTRGPIAIYINLGGGMFAAEQTLDASALQSASTPMIMDANNDGLGDLVVFDSQNRDIAVFLQN